MNLINDKGLKKAKYSGSGLQKIVFKRLNDPMCILF